ncbi:MAG TPA: hypothetical protein DD414_08105, partial [Lachnospiraceae bacterium]|nr:hypothetical protein [Lachnospiraceae bacterium]
EKDLTLYAKWEKVSEKPEDPIEEIYAVTFDLQGHGTALTEYENYKNIKKGEVIQKPQDPQEEGYIFGGWYQDAGCTIAWDFVSNKVEKDLTLYAKWTQEETKEEDLGEVLPADVPSEGIPEETLWEADIEDVQYTGKAIKPEVHIYWGKERLSEGVDYTLKYRNNVQANEDVDTDKAPCVEIKYKKYYPGAENKSIPFKILPVGLDDVTADDIVVACTNKVQKKVPLVTWNGKKLSNKKDFSIDYPDEGMPGAYQDVGEYTITVSEGRSGNFIGTKNVNLIVTDKVPVSKVSVQIPKQTYQKGTELRPEPVVKYKGKKLEIDSDYTVEYENNTEIGTAYALIIGTGDYTGVKRAAFKITGVSLKKAKVEKIEPKEYDDSFQTPACMVTYQGSILKEHVDYEVSYMNNRNAGKASVTLTGIGAYSGTVKKTFRITAYDLKADGQKGAGKLVKGLEEEITASRIEYAKGICKPEPVLIYKGKVLRKGRDYSLSYKNNKKAADAGENKAPTIVIRGKGNFKGTVNKAFTITE